MDDGLQSGRKVWNLLNAIWALQGRHRDIVKFADYIYDVGYAKNGFAAPHGGRMKDYLSYSYHITGIENGEWKWIDMSGQKMDRAKVEDFKTRYYAYEGWDPATGHPTRSTLQSMGLKHVADELEKNGRLGAEA